MRNRFLEAIRKKRTLIIFLVIAVAGIFIGWKIFFNKDSGYVMGKVQKQTIVETITESGNVTTNGKVNIYSPTNGVIDEVYVSNGDQVKENQKLFSVKSTATPQEKATAFSAYQTAASALQQAQNNRRETTATVQKIHDDVKNHDKDETYTQKETRTTAEVAHDNAYDALLAAQANLVSAEIAYQATQNSTVTAPISGTISNLAVIKGSVVIVNNVLVPTSPILNVGNLGDAEIIISVGEGDINKIQVDQQADIKLDAIGDKLYKGTVSRFDYNGTTTQSVIKFNVYIKITDLDGKIKPGMTADVDITANELKDVLSVPNAAIKPYQKGRAVRILGTNGKPEYVSVKTGVRGKEFTQILEGLEEGQEIIISLPSEQKQKSGLFGF